MKKKRSFRFVRILFLIILAIVVTVIAFGQSWGLVLPEPIPSWISKLSPATQQVTNKIPQINVDQVDDSLTNLTERSTVLKNTVSQIAAEAVKVDDQDKPLTEKALEYGRYLYCKQVVEDWERPSPDPLDPSATESAD